MPQVCLRLRVVIIVASLTIMCSVIAVGQNEANSADQQSVLQLRVPHALPLVNAEQILIVRINHQGHKPLSATLSLRYRRDSKSGNIGHSHHIQLLPGQATVVEQPWTPRATGQYTLTTRLQPHEPDRWAAPRVATQTVTVVKRPFYFHYWDADPDLAYITACMMNNEEKVDYWTNRGVTALRWAGGLCYAEDNTVDSMAEGWVNAYRNDFPGVVIDEFGSGGELDEFLGEALIKADKLEPDNYLAVYCVSVGGEQMAEGLRAAADLVLVEAYQSSAVYGYAGIRARTQSAVDNGLADRTVVALGIDGYGITTAQELRRQLHFTRYTFPEMPGVAFFGSMRALTPTLNELLGQFYIGPVLRVAATPEDGAWRVEVCNIGGTHAPTTSIRLQTGKDNPQINELAVPALAVGEVHSVYIASENVRPVSEYRDDHVVLGPPRLWDEEPAELRPNASTQWPRGVATAQTLQETFDDEPPIELEYDTSGKEGYDGNVSAATYPLPASQGGSCELRFDLQLVRDWYYGGIWVALNEQQGESQVKLALGRGDHQPGVYITVLVHNSDGVDVHESIPMILKPEVGYHVKLCYQQSSYVRAAILADNGAKLWDTGEIPTYGGMQFDELRFGVKSGDGCSLEWNDQHRAMFLRGMSPNSRYVISGYLDNVEFTSFSR